MEPVVIIAEAAAYVAAGLVLLAGIAKVVDPEVTRDALGLPDRGWSRLAVRVLGAGEVALATAVTVLGGRLLFSLLAAAYLAFTVVAGVQGRRARSCGCLGASQARPGALHLGVNLVAAAAAGLAGGSGATGLLGMLPDHPLAAAASAGLVVLAVVLARLVLTTLPEVLASSRQVLVEART